MPDRHLRVLRDAARAAARRARRHHGDAPASTDARGEELERLAQRARRRLDAGLLRRATPRTGGSDGA
jgi:DNA-directed RNA polymerase subunit K/omega